MVAATEKGTRAIPRSGEPAAQLQLTPAQEEQRAQARERARQKATKASAQAAADRRIERRHQLVREHAQACAHAERLAADYLALPNHGSEEAVRLQARALAARAAAARIARQLAAAPAEAVHA